ncbi:hypothetical protein HELRODRAFT_176837 [Helobdella robusta]|uniref:Uncharacterized protein n=1 Tax=Helobdella robusta TaxID=6412 RepID=T1FAY2_HELRO|nr:hypothetical protein HELRODRAFT_176837 [Helobdella robusta]ESN99663.1 hypothetical protein HELRODRAFT_176837 [Helobdella robusta]
MAPTLQQCPVCFNHYRSTPDEKLCRHGGKVKGQECSGSRKKVDPSGARPASPHRSPVILSAWITLLSELKFALGRVSCLSAHDALTIIRNALSLPKLMYFLRTSKHIDPSKLGEFDGALRTALSSICNVQAPGRMHANTLESRQMFGVGCYGPWHPRRTIRKPDKQKRNKTQKIRYTHKKY